MAYEIGTASSTFDLMNKLTAFMASVSGWTLWSNISDYDKVYRSLGSTGVNEIFIRQRIGPVEHFLRGADQYDYGSGTGDTGFLNFQSYVSFPQGGDAYAGASEIGQFGPRRFFVSGSFRLYHQDILSNQPGGTGYVKVGTPQDPSSEPSETTPDYYGMERNRWTSQQQIPSGTSSFASENKPLATDSHRYFYIADQTQSKIYRYSLRRTGGHINNDGTVDQGYEMPDVEYIPTYIVYVEDRQTRRPWLYVSGKSRSNFSKINLLDNTVTHISGPPAWPDWGGGQNGQYAESVMTWDGLNHIYLVRSGSGFSGNNTITGDWGRLNIQTGSWQITSNPDNPEFRAIPSEPTDYRISARHGFGFLSKKLSGFEFDRIYISIGGSGTNDLLYMDLDEDGTPPPSSPYWISQGTVPIMGSYFSVKGEVKFNRFGRMFHCSESAVGRPNGIYQISSMNSIGRLMTYCDIKNSGNVNWTSSSCYYFPEHASGPVANHEFIDGYACRVRTSIGSDTEYIFIADEDRVIVATKSNALLDDSLSDNISEWSVAYMGAIESRYDTIPYAEFAEDVSAGYSKKVKLTNVHGAFEEGEKYFVIDTSGGDYSMYNHLWNKTYNMAPSESVTVLKLEGDVATVSLNHNYSAGTKIALDPQPVGLFLWEFEKFQMTNVVNRLYDDFCGSDDPSAQIYTCSIPEGEVGTSVDGAIVSNTSLPVWEYIVSTSEYEGRYNGREARGKLKGMYALGKASGLSEGQIVAVGSDAYYIIEPPDYNKFVLIGPIN